MSASQSNLSDPHFGYDLVVAVTQASVNTTLKQLMAGLTSPEVVVCYVYDDNNNLVPIDYATLKANAKGSDPFTVPNGVNPNTNTDLINLTAANFAGGVKAQLGLPDLPLANLPNIATLGAGTSAPVLFNLVTLVEAEGETLGAAADAIKTQIIDQFTTLSVTQVLEKFIAIVVDTVLQTAENVVVTILDVFAKLLQGVITVLTMPLEIPVLSWLYSEITDGEELSFLDVTCLIAAIPVTIIYKLASAAANNGNGSAPFTAGEAFTDGLINAQSFAEIQALFVLTPARPAPAPHRLMMTAGLGDGPPPLSPGDPLLDQSKLKTFGFVTGIASLIGAAVLVVTVSLQRVIDAVPQIPDNTWAKRLATIAAAGNFLYVSPNLATLVNARTDNWYSTLNNVLTCVSLGKSLAAIVAAIWSNATVGKVFAFIETFINVVWNVPVIANIVYNSGTETTTYKSLIPESIGNFCFNLGGILEFPIALMAPTPAKLVVILVQYGFMATYGVFMIIAGGIYQFGPNQEH